MQKWKRVPYRGIALAVAALLGAQAQSALADEPVTYAGDVAAIINEIIP